MLEFAVGLLAGLLISLPCCWIAYIWGRYRGHVEAKWAGYDVVAKAKRKE